MEKINIEELIATISATSSPKAKLEKFTSTISTVPYAQAVSVIEAYAAQKQIPRGKGFEAAMMRARAKLMREQGLDPEA